MESTPTSDPNHPDPTADRRSALRARLRHKINDKRRGRLGGAPAAASDDSAGQAEQLARTVAADPPLAMLQLGVDDPQVLQRLPQLLRSRGGAASLLKDLQKPSTGPAAAGDGRLYASAPADDAGRDDDYDHPDEEEAPPP